MSAGSSSVAASPARSAVVGDRARRLFVGTALLVLCVLSGALGLNLGHREPARAAVSARTAAGGLSLAVTDEFVHSRRLAGAAALGLRDPLALASTEYAPSGLLAGRVADPDPVTLLPRGLAARQRQPIALDGVRGWLYADVAVPRRAAHAEVFAVPAAAGGSLVLVCDVPLLLRVACEQVIAGARLSGAGADRASPGAAGLLAAQVGSLRRTETGLSAAAVSASTRRARAGALGELGAAYGRTGAALRGAPGSAPLSRVLVRLAGAYRALAHAVRGGRRAAVIAARSETDAARENAARVFARIAGPQR